MRPARVAVYVTLQRALTEIWAEFQERENTKQEHERELYQWISRNNVRYICRNFLYC